MLVPNVTRWMCTFWILLSAIVCEDEAEALQPDPLDVGNSSIETMHAPYSAQLCAIHGIGCERMSDKPEISDRPAIPHQLPARIYSEKDKINNKHNIALLEIEISQLESAVYSLHETISKRNSISGKALRLWYVACAYLAKIPYQRITLLMVITNVIAVSYLAILLVKLFQQQFSQKCFSYTHLKIGTPEEGIEAIIQANYRQYRTLMERKDSFLRVLQILPILFYMRANFLIYQLVTSHVSTLSAISMTLSALTGFQVSSAFLSAQLFMFYICKQCMVDFVLWKPLDRISYSAFQKVIFESFQYNNRTMRRLARMAELSSLTKNQRPKKIEC